MAESKVGRCLVATLVGVLQLLDAFWSPTLMLALGAEKGMDAPEVGEVLANYCLGVSIERSGFPGGFESLLCLTLEGCVECVLHGHGVWCG